MDTPFGELMDSLENIGLKRILENLLPEFRSMVDKLQGLFHSLQKDRHVGDLNRIVGHFRDNWPRAIKLVRKEKGSGSEVDLAGFMAFMETYKKLLDESINADSNLENSDVVKFMDQLTHLFNALEAAYGNFYMAFKAFKIPIIITWDIFQATNKIVQMIPKELIDTQFFNELLQTPNLIFRELASTINTFNEEIRKSPIGHMVPIGLQVVESMVKNWVAQQEHEINRQEM